MKNITKNEKLKMIKTKRKNKMHLSLPLRNFVRQERKKTKQSDLENVGTFVEIKRKKYVRLLAHSGNWANDLMLAIKFN